MIDSQNIVYIEYKNFSQDPLKIEIQKDYIAQVIKKIRTDKDVFVENTDVTTDLKSSFENEHWRIHCLQCVLPDEGGEINFSSLKKLSKTSPFVNDLSFDIQNTSGSKTSWKIELAELKKVFYISAKKYIQKNEILNLENMDVSSCISIEEKCLPKNYFLSLIEAQEKLNLYVNKKQKKYLNKGDEIDIKMLSSEIFVHFGDKVKVLFSPSNFLTVQTTGQALTNAELGEKVRIQISDWFKKDSFVDTKKIIEGKVVGLNEVEYVE